MSELLDDFSISQRSPAVILGRLPGNIPINLAGGVITGSGVPTNAKDLVTKEYVDSQKSVTHPIDMTGHSVVNVPLTPPTDSSAVSKAYLQQQLQVVINSKYDAAGSKLTNVGNPGADSDAANKGYVDRTVTTAMTDRGGNTVRNVGAPVLNSDAANKQYVDAFHDITAGNLDMHGHRIVHLAPGVAADDAVNKGQFDAALNVLGVRPTLSGPITGTIDVGGNKLINVGAATLPTDAVTYGAVTAAISGVSINDMGNREVLNVAEPTALTSAANKQYVDSAVASIDIHDMINQRVTNVGEPTFPSDAATKKYVDDEVTRFTVIQRTSNADMNNNKVTNVAIPTAANDGATKGYVDTVKSGINFHDMQNQRVTNVGVPTDSTDAVTKGYVQTYVAGLASAGAPTDMKGARLINLGASQAATDAINKGELDAALSTVSLSDLKGRQLTNLGNPVGTKDAVNLKYMTDVAKGIILGNLGEPVAKDDAVTVDYFDKRLARNRNAYEIYRSRVQTVIGDLAFHFAYSAGPGVFRDDTTQLAIGSTGSSFPSAAVDPTAARFEPLSGGEIVPSSTKGVNLLFDNLPTSPEDITGFVYIGQLTGTGGDAVLVAFDIKKSNTGGGSTNRKCVFRYNSGNLEVVTWSGTVTKSVTAKADQFFAVVYDNTNTTLSVFSSGKAVGAAQTKSSVALTSVAGKSTLNISGNKVACALLVILTGTITERFTSFIGSLRIQ